MALQMSMHSKDLEKGLPPDQQGSWPMMLARQGVPQALGTVAVLLNSSTAFPGRMSCPLASICVCLPVGRPVHCYDFLCDSFSTSLPFCLTPYLSVCPLLLICLSPYTYI